MIKTEINELRDELNNLILNGANYEKIYETSVKLDLLIAKYYKLKLI